jgi:phage shock protein B
MLLTFIESLGPLSIGLVAVIGVFVVKALRVIHDRPIQTGPTAEDRLKLRRMTETIEKMESRVTALETLLKEDQANREVSHEKSS